MQTIGIANLLSCGAVWWDNVVPNNELIVVNGWITNEWLGLFPDCDALFAGIHVSGELLDPAIEVLRKSKYPIGTRDPETAIYLRGLGVDATFIGCATLLFPKHNGNRYGRLFVDSWFSGLLTGDNSLSQGFKNIDMTWRARWSLAARRIEQLKTAEEVFTSRLHIALPCLAMGTPVYIERNADTRRFSILDSLGVEYERLFTMDVNLLKCRYKSFLERHLGVRLEYTNPQIPEVDKNIEIRRINK